VSVPPDVTLIVGWQEERSGDAPPLMLSAAPRRRLVARDTGESGGEITNHMRGDAMKLNVWIAALLALAAGSAQAVVVTVNYSSGSHVGPWLTAGSNGASNNVVYGDGNNYGISPQNFCVNGNPVGTQLFCNDFNIGRRQWHLLVDPVAHRSQPDPAGELPRLAAVRYLDHRELHRSDHRHHGLLLHGDQRLAHVDRYHGL
jgi:hypothetical protein